MGLFPDDAPHTVRAFGLAAGRLTIEELVDRYPLRCKPIRDLIVDYLRERQASLDFASIDAISRTLAGLFWARIEAITPGIGTLHLPPDTVTAWKDDLATKKRIVIDADGKPIEVRSPRLNAKKERQHRKARVDQRTRERLPVLPILVRSAADRHRTAERRLHVAEHTRPGVAIPIAAVLSGAPSHRNPSAVIWAEETATGKRRNLSYEAGEAFWAWATIEVLRLTGIRCEELLELTNHSITEYRLPSTGELVPLLQIAPSKTDTERLLLVSPELPTCSAASSPACAAPAAQSRSRRPTTSTSGSGIRRCRCYSKAPSETKTGPTHHRQSGSCSSTHSPPPDSPVSTVNR